jgi:hypothetical protein
VTSVSTSTAAFVSLWPSTLVRLMSASPVAHRPIEYQPVSSPVVVRTFTSTCSQVLAGVMAFQEAMSCVASKPWRYDGDVH